MAKIRSTTNLLSIAVCSAVVPGAALAPACAQDIKLKAADNLLPSHFPADCAAQSDGGVVQ